MASISQAFSSNVAAGSLIFVGVSWEHSGSEGVSGVTDGLGNTYVEMTNCRVYDSTATQVMTAFYAKNVTGGACTPNVAFLGARTARRITIREYSNLDTTSPLDQSAGQLQAAPGTGTDAVTSGAVTTTTDGQTIVGLTMDNTAGNTVSAGTGFGNLVSGPASIPPITSEGKQQAAAGSVAATFTILNDHRMMTAVATFKAGSLATTPQQSSRISMMGCSGAATAAPPPTPPSGLGKYGGAPGSHIVTGLSTSEIQFEVDTWAADGCQTLRYDWLNNAGYQSNFETALDRCESHGIKTICCLNGTSGPLGTSAAAAYAHAAAVRLGDRISVWEWVNEPNLGPTMGTSRYTGAQYGAELAAVYAQLKSDLPGCIVANGGMGIWAGSGVSYPPTWWPLALSGGASGHFDMFNAHCYNDPSTSQWTTMMALEYESKPRIVTEAGSQGTASIITNALTDSRADVVCIYTMFTYESAAWAIRGTARETAYQAVTGA